MKNRLLGGLSFEETREIVRSVVSRVEVHADGHIRVRGRIHLTPEAMRVLTGRVMSRSSGGMAHGTREVEPCRAADSIREL